MPSDTRYQIALRATLVNSSVNTLLAMIKIFVGIVGHSQALVADGIHSFSDLITDLFVLLASKMGGQGPDAEHPYGHHRIETIASIVVSLLLIGVALGIAYDTLHHIKQATVLPRLPVIIVAVISILANEGLYRYTLKAATQAHSDLLRSNALHNRGDALVSFIVLISVIGTLLGFHALDSIGAFVIAALILQMGFKMIWKSAQELIDAGVDETLLHKIKQHITDTPGVCSVHQLRTRSHGGYVFTDVHIQVDPFISVSEGHYISEHVHARLIQDFEAIKDVTVHIDPEDDEAEHLSAHLPTRQAIEEQLEKACHALPYYALIEKTVFHYTHGRLHIELFLPLHALKQGTDPTLLAEQYRSSISAIPDIQQLTLYYH